MGVSICFAYRKYGLTAFAAQRQPVPAYLNRTHRSSFRETLIDSESVIASDAKQSRVTAKSKASESPRRFAPRDDGIVQYFLKYPSKREYAYAA